MTGFFPDLANNTASGMIPVSLLYQDSQPYSLLGSLSETLTGLETLQKATRVTFAYNATADVDQSAAVSFCIANLQLLPSTVNTTGWADLPLCW